MLTDTIQISGLSETVVKAINKKAEEAGMTTEEYLRHLIEEDAASPLSMRLLYAPVREQIRESGLTEDELDALVKTERRAMREEKQAK